MCLGLDSECTVGSSGFAHVARPDGGERLRCGLSTTVGARDGMRIFGIAGWSGAGKTTLIERLLPVLKARGLTVSVIKHAHERFDIDRPGKDSFRMREAGSHEVLISSPKRWALMHEVIDAPEPRLADLLPRLGPCDVVLVEGFKRDPIPKLEVHRASVGKPLLAPSDPHVIGVASDGPVETDRVLLSLDDLDAIASLIEAHATVA